MGSGTIFTALPDVAGGALIGVLANTGVSLLCQRHESNEWVREKRLSLYLAISDENYEFTGNFLTVAAETAKSFIAYWKVTSKALVLIHGAGHEGMPPNRSSHDWMTSIDLHGKARQSRSSKSSVFPILKSTWNTPTPPRKERRFANRNLLPAQPRPS